jgi:hypothetical protein
LRTDKDSNDRRNFEANKQAAHNFLRIFEIIGALYKNLKDGKEGKPAEGIAVYN